MSPERSATKDELSPPRGFANRRSVAVIIPALDEEGAIGSVVRGLSDVIHRDRSRCVEEIVVVDNGSRDQTALFAREAGATVVEESRRGYGSACLRGIEHLASRREGPPEIVVFSDGDGSSDPRDLPRLLAPIERGEAELVIGARNRLSSAASFTFAQRIGNGFACALLRTLYRTQTTDLGPFRAIRWCALMRIGMVDRDYGWTVEMQVKAARLRLPTQEIDVSHRARAAGRSKVSGSVRGVIGAGSKILLTVVRYHSSRKPL